LSLTIASTAKSSRHASTSSHVGWFDPPRCQCKPGTPSRMDWTRSAIPGATCRKATRSATRSAQARQWRSARLTAPLTMNRLPKNQVIRPAAKRNHSHSGLFPFHRRRGLYNSISARILAHLPRAICFCPGKNPPFTKTSPRTRRKQETGPRPCQHLQPNRGKGAAILYRCRLASPFRRAPKLDSRTFFGPKRRNSLYRMEPPSSGDHVADVVRSGPGSRLFFGPIQNFTREDG